MTVDRGKVTILMLLDLSSSRASAVVSCIGESDRCMLNNRLKLKSDKTNFILLGTPRQPVEKAKRHSVQLNGTDVQLSTTVTCLRVLIDSERTFAAHIKHLTGRCIYQLRQLRTVAPYQSPTMRTIVTASLDPQVLFTFVFCNPS